MSWTLEDEIAWSRNNPFRNFIGMEITALDDKGNAVVSLEVDAHLLQAYGMVHGGVYCVLLDTVMGTSVRAGYQRDVRPNTIDLNVSFLRPSGVGRLTAAAELVKKGRNIAVCTGSVSDSEGRLAALGRASFLLRDN
ncbi:PaaI family thioesterase [Tepidiphilus olei]|uniref:PaaI family thioesterase n=1 Tax=Tepidiphilus olei TaxID=2502184 RepID=UPI00115E339E|nr:PaaI family thioesterase [Tepidiphilus olei]